MDLNFETLKKLNLQYPNNQDFVEVVRKMVWKKENQIKKIQEENKGKIIFESPDGGKTVYKREFGNYNKREKIENNMEMKSLYDYLGHAAGADLGQQVAYAAAKAGVVTETRQVSNPVYKGPVMLYPRSFLDLYFKGGLNEGTSGKQLLKG